MGVQLKALFESTLLAGRREKDGIAQIGPLVEGLRQRENLVRKHPEDVNFRCQVVSGYLAVAQWFAESGATDDALQNVETAASLLTPGLSLFPGNLRLQALESRIELERGTGLARDGKAALAAKAAERAIVAAEKLAAADPSYLYDLACALALKVRLDPAAPGPPAAAIAALRNAVEAGFDNVYKLESDPHLVPLHSFNEFRELVTRLKRVR